MTFYTDDELLVRTLVCSVGNSSVYAERASPSVVLPHELRPTKSVDSIQAFS